MSLAALMEAARILKVIGVKPHRTIRVALWSGEEERLLGSQAYVKEHFNSAEIPSWSSSNLAATSMWIPAPAKSTARRFRTSGSRRSFCARRSRPLKTLAFMARLLCAVATWAAPTAPSRTAGNRDETVPHRIRHSYASYEPRQLRTNHRRRRQEIRYRHCGCTLRSRHAH
ncbi:MAG: M28 family peptidase [Acidobacteria bacterium]|nr:M28 family peptidase [Acidobacteriota bacterium]MBI3421394.1 M28 family peptidase [Acidobacteriota bacterium]